MKVGFVVFGDNIRHLRTAAGMSQSQLAERLTKVGLEVSQQTIQKIEKGARPLKLTEAESVADVLSAGLDSLLATDVSHDELRAESLGRKVNEAHLRFAGAWFSLATALQELRAHLSDAQLSAASSERFVRPWVLRMLELSPEELFEATRDPEVAQRLGLIGIVDRLHNG